MSTFTAPARAPTDSFAPGVEWRQEVCRGRRQLIIAVHHGRGLAIGVEPAELEAAARGDDLSGGVCRELVDGGFLAGEANPTEVVAEPGPRSQTGGIRWRGADDFVVRCHDGFLHHLFTPRWVAAQVACGVLGSVGIAVAIFGSHAQLRATPAQMPLIIVLGFVAVAIHELGHAVVTVHYGRHVRSVGLRLHLGLPAFFVESLDALLLSRRQRLVQAAAGPFAEWNLTGLVALAVITLPSDGPVTTLLHRFVVVNAIGVTINLLPFAGLDGSLLLADAIREPDLAIRSRSAIAAPRSATGRDRWWLVGYGVANALAAALLMLSAAFFWWQLFGDLTCRLVVAGPVGIVGLAMALGVLVLPLRRAAMAMCTDLGHRVRRAKSSAVFRLERRWRVEAISAFRVLPGLASLDETALGIVAGLLKRVDVRTATPSKSVASHCFVEFRRRRARILTFQPVPRGFVLEIGEYLAHPRTHRSRFLVLLPTKWPELLDVTRGERCSQIPNAAHGSGITVEPVQGGDP